MQDFHTSSNHFLPLHISQGSHLNLNLSSILIIRSKITNPTTTTIPFLNQVQYQGFPQSQQFQVCPQSQHLQPMGPQRRGVRIIMVSIIIIIIINSSQITVVHLDTNKIATIVHSKRSIISFQTVLPIPSLQMCKPPLLLIPAMRQRP